MAIFISKDTFHKDTPENIEPANESGDPAGYAGVPGSPAGSPNASSNTQPPITNRGAQFTIPPENRSLIDWASLTFKKNDPKIVAEDIGLDPSLFTQCSFGFSGYRKSLRFENICIYFDGREDMSCHVEMSGQGCRHCITHCRTLVRLSI